MSRIEKWGRKADGRNDMEKLESLSPRPAALRQWGQYKVATTRQKIARDQAQYLYLSDRPVTLPRLKFLENKDNE